MKVEKVDQDSLGILFADGSLENPLSIEDLKEAKKICINVEKELELKGIDYKSIIIIFSRLIADLLAQIDEPDFTKLIAYSLLKQGDKKWQEDNTKI